VRLALDWIKKMVNFVTAKSQNEMFDYLKLIVYETDDPLLAWEKERAMDYLYNGLSFLEKEDFKKAVSYIESAIDIFEKKNDQLRKSFCFFFMGDVYHQKKEKETAKDYFKRALEYFEQKKHRMRYACENKLKEMEL